MSTASKDFLVSCHRAAREAVRVLEFPFRKSVWKGIGGIWQGNAAGSSIDFRDHRLYVPGDDPRHINWQAYGRTGDYIMKVYEQEVRPQVDIIFDESASMGIDEAKARRSVELLYFCLENAWKVGASVRVRALHANGLELVDDKLLSSHQWPFAWKKERAVDVHVQQILWKQGGFKVLISDLLYDGEQEGHLARIPKGGRDGFSLVLSPYTLSEEHPEWNGNIEFENCETGVSRKQRVIGHVLQRYQEKYQQHFAWWREKCLHLGVHMARVNSNAPLIEALKNEALLGGSLELAY